MANYNKSYKKSLKILQEKRAPQNGPKYNKGSHTCGLERDTKSVLLNSRANVPSRSKEMGQTWSKDLQCPPTNSLKPRSGPNVK